MKSVSARLAKGKAANWYGPVKVATAGTYSQVKRPRPKKKQG